MTDELRSGHAALSAEQTIRLECLKLAVSSAAGSDSALVIAAEFEKFVVGAAESDHASKMDGGFFRGSPIEKIRRQIFQMSQAEFAKMVGVSQSTISKWESGLCEPNRFDLSLIRIGAKSRFFAWEDRWFFDPPSAHPSVPAKSEGTV